MSFYKYSNVNQSSSAGWTSGTLWTDDPAFVLSNNYIGYTMYFNDMAIGKAFSKDVAQPTPLGYTLYRFLENMGGADPADPGLHVGVTDAFVGIDIYTHLLFNTAINKIAFKQYFYQLANNSSPTGATTAVLYTDDSSVINVANENLVGKSLFINGTKCGAIVGNELFDGNISGANCSLPWYNLSALVRTADAKGKVLMKITFTVDVALGTTNSLPSDINSIAAIADAESSNEWLYCMDNYVPGFKFFAGEFGALYHPGHLAADYLTLTADNQVLWDPIAKGLLGLYLNDRLIAPIVDLRTGFGYQNESLFGQSLPASYTANPWSPTRRLGFYMTSLLANVVNFNEPISKVEFKPYYKITMNGASLRFSVAGPPALANYSTQAVPMIELVRTCVNGKELYVNNARIGAITGFGSKDLIIDGRGPINFDGFSGNHSSPAFQEYYFDVAAPVVMPTILANTTVTLDAPGTDTSVLLNGTMILIGLPPIKEGINGLVGQRLIVNEIYIGIITSNTLDSITTAVANTTDLTHVPKEVSGIWRLETVAPIGRVPLCVSSYIAVSEWPNYPYFKIDAEHYNETYAFNQDGITHYPNELDIYTRRDMLTDLNSQELKPYAHVLPKWVEHAHVDTTTHRFQLAEQANTELGQPIIAKYVSHIGSLANNLPMFRKFWQFGRVTCIPYEAYLNQGNTSFWPANANGFYHYQNIPGQLESVPTEQSSEGSSKVSDLFSLVPLIITSGIPLPANIEILTPTGSVWTDAQGHLPNGTIVCTVESAVQTNSLGLLPPGTIVITSTGRILVGADGLLPAGLSVSTPTGPVLVLADGTLPAHITINSVGTTAAGPDGTLMPGVIVLTPTGSVIVDLGMRLPAGLVLDTPTGTVTVDAYGHLLPGTVVIDIYLGTATVLPDGTLPVGTTVRIHNGFNGGIVILLQRPLCEALMVETACAPHPIELTARVLECATMSAISESGAVLTHAGSAYEESVSTLSIVNVDRKVNLLMNSILSPAVSINTVISTSMAPGKTGAVIQLKRGVKANLPASARLGEALVTLDTAELFIGTGTGLRKVSDVIVSDTEPGAEDRVKLWYCPVTNLTYAWKVDQWYPTSSEASMDYGAF